MSNQSDPLDIEVLNILNNGISLRSILGNYIVLHFLPEYDEPESISLACDFRNSSIQIGKLGADIVVVNRESAKLLHMFLSKYNLSFNLWSDPNGELMKSFGVMSESNWFGKKSIKIRRSTFILNPEGKVIKSYKSFRPKGHVEQVLKFLKRETK